MTNNYTVKLNRILYPKPVFLIFLKAIRDIGNIIMNICYMTNNHAVKLNLYFFQNITLLFIFSKAIRDIGYIIAASDKPN